MLCDSKSCIMVTCHHLLIRQHYCCSHLLITWCFLSTQILPHHHQQYYFMAYWSSLVFCWHFQFGSWSCQVQSHVTDSLQASSGSLLEIAGKVKFCDEDSLFLHTVCTHQPMLALSWYCIWCLDLTGFYTSDFITSQAICTPVFLLKWTHSNYGNNHTWVLWNMFRYFSHLSTSRYVVFTFLCPKPWTILLHCNYSFSLHC